MAKKTEDVLKDIGLTEKQIKGVKEIKTPTLTIDTKKIRKAEEEASYKEVMGKSLVRNGDIKITNIKQDKDFFKKMFGKKKEEKAIREAEKARKKAFEKGRLSRDQQRAFAKQKAMEAIQKQRLKDYIKSQKARAKPKTIRLLYKSPFSGYIGKPRNPVEPKAEFFEGLGAETSAGIENFQQNGLKPQMVGSRQMDTEEAINGMPKTQQFKDWTKEDLITGTYGRGRPTKIENLSTEELRARVAALKERDELERQIAEEALEREMLLREAPKESTGIGLDIDIMGWGSRKEAPKTMINPPSLDIGSGINGFDLSVGRSKLNKGGKRKKPSALDINFW